MRRRATDQGELASVQIACTRYAEDTSKRTQLLRNRWSAIGLPVLVALQAADRIFMGFTTSTTARPDTGSWPRTRYCASARAVLGPRAIARQGDRLKSVDDAESRPATQACDPRREPAILSCARRCPVRNVLLRDFRASGVHWATPTAPVRGSARRPRRTRSTRRLRVRGEFRKVPHLTDEEAHARESRPGAAAAKRRRTRSNPHLEPPGVGGDRGDLRVVQPVRAAERQSRGRTAGVSTPASRRDWSSAPRRTTG